MGLQALSQDSICLSWDPGNNVGHALKADFHHLSSNCSLDVVR